MFESRFARGGEIAAFAAVTVALSGCARSLAGDTYQRGQTMQAQTGELGVVESLRPSRKATPTSFVPAIECACFPIAT